MMRIDKEKYNILPQPVGVKTIPIKGVNDNGGYKGIAEITCDVVNEFNRFVFFIKLLHDFVDTDYMHNQFEDEKYEWEVI